MRLAAMIVMVGCAAALADGDGEKPANAKQWVQLGETEFKAGRIAESLAAFDKAVELEPRIEPRLWQRGIAQYYAGKFKEGRAQFELHKKVNPHDVENAAWHYLCVAGTQGPEAAVKALIEIDTTKDTRVPMKQVYEMFAGRLTPQQVLTAVEKSDEAHAGEKFYAHLYAALWYEANKKPDEAKKWMKEAATRAESAGYMGDVARVHLKRRNEKR